MGNLKYDRANVRWVSLKLNRKTDAKIIERLENQENRQNYIKTLIKEDIGMTKQEAINTLTDRGVFELVDTISKAITEDSNPAHAAVNRRLAYHIDRIGQMRNWAVFSACEMINQATMAYGLWNGLAMVDLDLAADLDEDLQDLYEIICNTCYPLVN